MQFILDPGTSPDVINQVQTCGPKVLEHLHYLTRTFAFLLHKERLAQLESWQLNPDFESLQLITSNSTSVSGPGVDPNQNRSKDATASTNLN